MSKLSAMPVSALPVSTRPSSKYVCIFAVAFILLWVVIWGFTKKENQPEFFEPSIQSTTLSPAEVYGKNSDNSQCLFRYARHSSGGLVNYPPTTCCDGQCRVNILDWNNDPKCPLDCYTAPNSRSTRKVCTLLYGNQWPRTSNGICSSGADCKDAENNYGKVGQLACCSGKCTKQLKHFNGDGKCPADCIKHRAGKKGSCDPIN